MLVSVVTFAILDPSWSAFSGASSLFLAATRVVISNTSKKDVVEESCGSSVVAVVEK